MAQPNANHPAASVTTAAPHRRSHVPRRAGLTLVEMLVSVTITLLVVFAIVQVFDIMGNTVAMGRATIEMAGQLRNVSNVLQQDLDNLTCPVEPWIDPDEGVGYFEYIEGPINVNLATGLPVAARSTDRDPLATTQSGTGAIQVLGDLDDILAMTVRSTGEPFVGRAPSGTVESNVAEVIWWVALYDTNGDNMPDLNDSPVLMRRVLLVRPDIDVTNIMAPDHHRFFIENDLSAHFDGTNMQTNSLIDLSDNSKRFAHNSTFPHEVALYVPEDTSTSMRDEGIVFPFEHEQSNAVYGDQFPESASTYNFYSSVLPRFITQETMAEASNFVVLTDVIGFDVRIYDADAIGIVFPNSKLAISPSDPEYAGTYSDPPVQVGTDNEHVLAYWNHAVTAITNGDIFRGAYVDLGFWEGIPSFSAVPPLVQQSKLGASPENATGQPNDTARNFVSFTTWPLTFERDGINQDGDVLTDEGFDGLDNIVNPDEPPPHISENGVDDSGERETRPPYDVAPTGIEVRLRMLEFGTGQVRQVSVVGDFAD